MDKCIVISDVDGCLTDGGLYYTEEGKVMKRFGAGDHEGLKLLKKNGISVEFITADKVGYPIVAKRMKDMSNSTIHIFNEIERYDFVKSLKTKYETVVFFGDGLGDALLASKMACDIFVCPNQSRQEVKLVADYITETDGGHGAFLDMAIWVSKKINKENYKELYD